MAQDVIRSERDVAAQVRSALIQEISDERFDLWIPDDTTWTWDGQFLTVEFQSDFVCQLAKKMLASDLMRLLGQIVGRENVEVRFQAVKAPSVSSSLNSKPPLRRTLSTPTQRVSVAGPRLADSNTQESLAEVGASSWSEFISGNSNKLAWTTANMIVAEPGRLTPVLLYGPTGCGKTLLAGAIAQQLRTMRRLRRVVHLTSEQFTNDFTEGLRGGGLPMFRRKYRDVDALVIDDIQFFFNKKSTLAEVRHTLDNLLRQGKQVVLTADRSLNELQQLGPELSGRLRGGLVSPLFPLDNRIRQTLLSRKLASCNVSLDEEVVEKLAERTTGDGRILSGLAHRLTAVSMLHSRKLTWDDCWDAVVDLVQATQPIVRLSDIEKAVCGMFGLEPDSLQSQSKMRSVSQPRMLAMFLARKYTPAAYKEIGEYFGRRRHSTVISAEKTVESWLDDNSTIEAGRGMTVRDAIRQVESQLQVG